MAMRDIIDLFENRNLGRKLSRAARFGYIIISASRGENTPAQNRAETERLKRAIIDGGWSYAPVWGGYIENQGEPTEREVLERSFIVTAADRKGDPKEGLFEQGAVWCGEYRQESFLYCGLDRPMAYYNSRGEQDGPEFSGKMGMNDAASMYFTDLYKNHRKGMDGRARRVTFECLGIAPEPMTIAGRTARGLGGELF
jgi:hypothetical protein